MLKFQISVTVLLTDPPAHPFDILQHIYEVTLECRQQLKAGTCSL